MSKEKGLRDAFDALNVIADNMDGLYVPNPRLTLADGFSLSIQASIHAYSTPRDNVGPYTHYEVGYPSDRPGDELLEYMEMGPDDNPVDTVYPYVPREVIDREIEAHGGIVEGKFPGE